MNKGRVSYECKYANEIYTVASIAVIISLLQTVNEYIGQLEFFGREKIDFTVVAQKSSSFYYFDQQIFD